MQHAYKKHPSNSTLKSILAPPSQAEQISFLLHLAFIVPEDVLGRVSSGASESSDLSHLSASLTLLLVLTATPYARHHTGPSRSRCAEHLRLHHLEWGPLLDNSTFWSSPSHWVKAQEWSSKPNSSPLSHFSSCFRHPSSPTSSAEPQPRHV